MTACALPAPQFSRLPLDLLSDPARPTIHRFFDTSPISPSGRFAALFELPQDLRCPQPGEAGRVVVCEIPTGRVVWAGDSAAWDTQLGAQVQWGASDSELLFNRMDLADWRPYGVAVDPASGAERVLQGTVYMADPVQGRVVSPCLRRIARVQPGYGVIVPPEALPANRGFPDDDGVWLTDLASGQSRLLISLAQIVAGLPAEFAMLNPGAGGLYAFHTKWNPQGTRLMVVLRWIADGVAGGLSQGCLVTMDAAGGDLRMAIGFRRWRGGHHPNWCPDGEAIVMNLRDPARGRRLARPKRLLEKLTWRVGVLRRLGWRYFSDVDALLLTRFRYDGTAQEILASGRPGTGHPSLNADQTQLLTDAYRREPCAHGDGTVPIRLIDLASGHETELVRIDTRPHVEGPRAALRIDPHPVFSRDGTGIVFNGSVAGRRQVFRVQLGSAG